MKKYQLPQGKILSTKLGIAIIHTLKFISVIEKETTEQTNRHLRVMWADSWYRTDKECIGGTQLQELHLWTNRMTVFFSASLRNTDVKPTKWCMDEHNCELLNEDRFDASGDFVE